MQQQNISNTEPTLEEVSNQFENWRKNKRNHREPIPKKLWQAAAELAKKHSINQVSKALHLSYADLKDHLYGPSIPKQKTKEKPASFIELKCDSPLMEQETTLEMQDPKGYKMRICFKGSPDFDVTALIKAFKWKSP